MTVLNMCIGNADAHLKNIGVLYSGRHDVELSPMFDLVSVTAFPRFRNDIPALSINGEKNWTPGKALSNFALNLGIGRKRFDAIVDEVTAGVLDTMPRILDMAELHPFFAEHARAMLMTWDLGCRRMRGDSRAELNTDVLERFGLEAETDGAQAAVMAA